MEIGPALFRENESPGALEAGNEAWRQVATRLLEALTVRLRVRPSLSRAWGAQRGFKEGVSSFSLSLDHWSGLCFIDWSQIHAVHMGKE